MTRRSIATISLTLAILSSGMAACISSARSENSSKPAQTGQASALPKERPAARQRSGASLTYDFDRFPAGSLPNVMTGTRTGKGALGDWKVLADNTAPSQPNVLAQLSSDATDYRFPIAVSNEGAFEDLDASVKFKAVSGRIDEAGGLVFRYKDADNYYLVRANALEDNFRLYRVVKGSRSEFAGKNVQVTPNQWHEIKVTCVGNQISCSFDGKHLINATDDTFKDAGKIGVWTKADSVTYFDDLLVSEK